MRRYQETGQKHVFVDNKNVCSYISFSSKFNPFAQTAAFRDLKPDFSFLLANQIICKHLSWSLQELQSIHCSMITVCATVD